ncbi:MAG: indolepyruvate ferredoxin oxidoreductase family protein [Spongiibacteraceae bacterium]
MLHSSSLNDRPISLDHKWSLDSTCAYMTGIEALVRLPILQHQRDVERGLNTAGFISGYRGSPLAGLDQTLWKARPFLQKHHIHFQPGVNEDLAATAVWGSQQVNIFEGAKYDGVFGMWYGKGPGVDRSMDAIKHANMFGTSRYGGVLAIAGDDHAARSSSVPHQSEHMFIAASIPVLNPANVQEVLDLGIYGWELSRYCGAWVALKAVTDNMDSAISAEIDPHRVNIIIPDGFALPTDGVHARWPDTPLAQEKRLNKYKIYAAREFARVNKLNRIVIDSERPRLGIITTGKAYLDVMQALEDLGIDDREAARIGLRVYKLGMSWPLEPVMTHEFARGLEEILVVEEKRSIVEDQLTSQLYNWPVAERPRVIGEFDEHGNDLLPNTGELTPAMVAQVIAARIRRFYTSATIEKRLNSLREKESTLNARAPLAERLPHYCSGCPHNTSTRVPEGSRAVGGIGCHYMATWMPDRNTLTFTQMGGEGTPWVGQAAFTDTPHIFQNLGDGTYFHSGILAIRQTIAAGVNITYKILHNDAVAMTGGQKVDGDLSLEKLIYQLRGEGVQRIAIVSDNPNEFRRTLPKFPGLTIDHRRRLDSIQKELRETQGTTVLIYRQTCAAEKRRRRKNKSLADLPKRAFINAAVCEGCGDCSKTSNCLSVLPFETELGRKRRIDQDACNKDFSCVDGFCPSFVTVHGGTLRKPQPVAVDSLPKLVNPKLPKLFMPWNIVVAGVGGTGVLTAAALIAMAAHIEGKGCATMNQTGLAQKFGAVVSHVRIAAKQSDIKAVRIPACDADLLIGCDLVVAASDDSLTRVIADRSHAVVNTAMAPTAAFVFDPDVTVSENALRDSIAKEVGVEKTAFVSATELSQKLMGSTAYTNIFLLGFAYQKGLLPVSAEALLKAIALNGVEIEENQRAFTWGRHAAVDIVALYKHAGFDEKVWQPLENLDDIIADRRARLVDYQDEQYAQAYVDCVEQVRRREAVVSGDAGFALSKTVARNLYKLMAYKDEYEVARLYSNGDFKKQLDESFEGDYELKIYLSPPMFSPIDKATGRPRKYALPGWVLKTFGLLAKFKSLRATALDPFGYTQERKAERDLIGHYRDTVQYVLQNLTQGNHSIAVDIAAIPEKIRGYGPVKMKAIEQAGLREKELLAQFNSPASPLIFYRAA